MSKIISGADEIAFDNLEGTLMYALNWFIGNSSLNDMWDWIGECKSNGNNHVIYQCKKKELYFIFKIVINNDTIIYRVYKNKSETDYIDIIL